MQNCDVIVVLQGRSHGKLVLKMELKGVLPCPMRKPNSICSTAKTNNGFGHAMGPDFKWILSSRNTKREFFITVRSDERFGRTRR